MQFANSKCTVLIASKHPVVCLGLQYCIASEPGFEDVGEASNAVEAYEKIVLLEPEIAILDIDMPEFDAFEFVNKLFSLRKAPKTILITSGEKLIDVNLIFQSQVNGLLFKVIRSADLVLGLNKVLEGNYVYSEAIFSFLSNGVETKINTTNNGIAFLTDLQKTIIVRRLGGKNMNNIAQDINLLPLEVRKHMKVLDEMLLSGSSKIA